MFSLGDFLLESLLCATLGTRGFSRVRRKFSVLAEGRHIFDLRPKPRDLTETGNRARKVSGTQGNYVLKDCGFLICFREKENFTVYCQQ